VLLPDVRWIVHIANLFTREGGETTRLLEPGGMGADYALKLPVVKRCVPKRCVPKRCVPKCIG